MLKQRPAPDAPFSWAEFSAANYRERAKPTPGDQYYPHLIDIQNAVRDLVRDATGTWLDYGAGTSPYRDLFENASLRTSDMDSTPWKYPPDYRLDEDGRIPAEGETFDGILSTQVLEHVHEPSAYLHEAMRVLKPGGRLVLTTHGIWEDHCPVDLRRWTAQGLAAEVTAAGFRVDQCLTLTCDTRAVLHLLQRELRAAKWPGSGVAARLFRCLQILDRRRPASLDRFSDRYLSHHGSAPAGKYRLYLALLISAARPEHPCGPAAGRTRGGR